MSGKLLMLRYEIAIRLADIADVLPTGYRLTLIARHTELADAQIVVTDDVLSLAAEALTKPVASVI